MEPAACIPFVSLMHRQIRKSTDNIFNTALQCMDRSKNTKQMELQQVSRSKLKHNAISITAIKNDRQCDELYLLKSLSVYGSDQ